MNELNADFENAASNKLAIIGFPFDENSSFMRGPADAPPLIREAFYSESSNLWTEAGINLGEEGIFFEAGDVEFSSNKDAFGEIEAAISNLLDRQLKPISLGGDHSITYPIVKAFSRKFHNLSILHFDAHPDLYDQLQGNRYSHACPFARIMEEKLAARLVQVGIRTLTGHQREQVEKFGVEVVEMKDWQDRMTFEFDSPLYISFDMDALDPAYSPGVSHHEPGGLSTRQAVDVIQRIRANIVGADIVEFNPRRDPLNITAMACAKLMKEIAAKMLSQ